MTTAPAPIRDDGNRSTWIVLAAITIGAIGLGFFLLYRYSEVLGYVKRTLEEPAAPHGWTLTPYSPEECVDAAMAWASDCVGIKTMCDMYVERVVEECLGSQDRLQYCLTLGDTTGSTEFGVPECRARGVLRDVDKESCSISYRSIDQFCKRTRVLAELAAEGSAPPARLAE